MKTKIFRITLWTILGIAILFTSLALNRPLSLAQEATVTPTAVAGTTIATAEVQDTIGSTDGIMLMAVVIVLIVIIPILARWRTWVNGKRK